MNQETIQAYQLFDGKKIYHGLPIKITGFSDYFNETGVNFYDESLKDLKFPFETDVYIPFQSAAHINIFNLNSNFNFLPLEYFNFENLDNISNL